MVNDLLKAMSAGMNIPRICNETDESFTYRLCYSALGQWCLNVGHNKMGKDIGTSKHNQTNVLNELLIRFTDLFPDISKRFVDSNNQQSNISVAIRRVYEETGYLLTDENNHNKLANFGRSIMIGNQTLFFGLPQVIHAINGLGVFSTPTDYKVTMKDFLIRDNLTCEQYLKSCFDPIDFYEKDVDVQELEFFNPLANRVPSQSWYKKIFTDFTMARKTETGPFYRVIRRQEGLYFADVPIETQLDEFTSYEYRRLYLALKKYYNHPLKVMIIRLDNEYSKIRIGGYLPNREYYFLLLLSWPERTAFDKVCFIIRNSLLKETNAMLENIGLEIQRGAQL